MTNSSQVADHCIVYLLSESAQKLDYRKMYDLTEKVTETKFLLYIYLHCTCMYNELITHMFR
jgi:hypothetical protein